jgi:hypothetical protein
MCFDLIIKCLESKPHTSHKLFVNALAQTFYISGMNQEFASVIQAMAFLRSVMTPTYNIPRASPGTLFDQPR